jgi:hypothetical protein
MYYSHMLHRWLGNVDGQIKMLNLVYFFAWTPVQTLSILVLHAYHVKSKYILFNIKKKKKRMHLQTDSSEKATDRRSM